MRVYLSGPISGCTDAECKDWREAVKIRLPDAIDPMCWDYRGREDRNYEAIVERDLEDIKECDALLVNCSGPSWGTAMEVFYAHRLDMPVLVVHPTEMPISPWLRCHATKFFPTLDSAMDWIEEHS